jgi:sugar phosphate isomerase/epimerase
MSELSAEMIAKLMAHAAAAGIDLGLAPEGAEHAEDMRETIPAVSLNRAVSELAHETGLNLKTSGLYLFQKRLITINAAGEEEEMDD